MAKFSLKDTIGYKYTSCTLGDYVVVKEIPGNKVKIKLLDRLDFQSGSHPEWEQGYASISISSLKRRPKTAYFDDSWNITDILKTYLTLPSSNLL